MGRRRVLVALVVGLVAVGQTAVGAVTTETSDTLSVVKDEDAVSNAEVAVRLSEVTPLQDVDTVVVGRDDVFADSLASGVLQAGSPLLLVPPEGPVPDRVMAELRRISPSRVIMLGGELALAPAVAEELAAEGYAVERRAGASRFETAVDIASTDAAAATTVILARAFPAVGATDPTQGFADALAAGGMAAENGWPVLLTQSDVLTGATRDYLAGAGVEQVEIMGGTAAISDAVEGEIRAMGIATERVAGPDRASTAAAVAEKRGAQSAAEVARVVLVEGQDANAWAGGFAAAAHSAAFDAPIVLAAGDAVPPATESFLTGAGPSFAVVPDDPADFPVLTCVAAVTACEEARVDLGLPPVAAVTFDPGEGQPVSPGQVVRVSISGAAPSTATAEGTCVPDGTEVAVDGGEAAVTVTGSGGCTLSISFPLPNGAVQTTSVTYAATSLELVSVGLDGQAAGGRHPAISPDASLTVFFSDGAVVPEVPGGNNGHWYAVRDTPEGRQVDLVDVRPDGTPGATTLSALDVPNIGGDRYVAFESNAADLDPDTPGRTSQHNGYVRDLETGTTTLVTLRPSTGEPASGPHGIDVSDDGTVAAYSADSQHVWHDLTTGEIGVVELPDGTPFEASRAWVPFLSDDGSTIAFYTDDPLLPADTDDGMDVYTYDIPTGELAIVSVASDGSEGTTDNSNTTDHLGISADGQRVVFVTDAVGVVPGDTEDSDVFLHDRTTGETTLLSADVDGNPIGGGRGTISPSGRWAAYTSDGHVDLPDENNCGVYRVDLATSVTERLDAGAIETAGGCPLRLQIADDGSAVWDTGASFSPADDQSPSQLDVYRSAPATE